MKFKTRQKSSVMTEVRPEGTWATNYPLLPRIFPAFPETPLSRKSLSSSNASLRQTVTTGHHNDYPRAGGYRLGRTQRKFPEGGPVMDNIWPLDPSTPGPGTRPVLQVGRVVKRAMDSSIHSFLFKVQTSCVPWQQWPSHKAPGVTPSSSRGIQGHPPNWATLTSSTPILSDSGHHFMDLVSTAAKRHLSQTVG